MKSKGGNSRKGLRELCLHVSFISIRCDEDDEDDGDCACMYCYISISYDNDDSYLLSKFYVYPHSNTFSQISPMISNLIHPLINSICLYIQ